MHIYRPSTRNAFTALNDCKPPVEISAVYSAELNAHIAVPRYDGIEPNALPACFQCLGQGQLGKRVD